MRFKKSSRAISLLRRTIQGEYLYFYLSSILSTAPGFLILHSKGIAFYGEIALATASLTVFAAFTQFRSYDILNHVSKDLQSLDEATLLIRLLPYQIAQASNILILFFVATLIEQHGIANLLDHFFSNKRPGDHLLTISIFLLFAISSFNGYFVSMARLLGRNNQIFLSYKLATIVCAFCAIFSILTQDIAISTGCLLIFISQYSVAICSCLVGIFHSLKILSKTRDRQNTLISFRDIFPSFSLYCKIQSQLFSGFLLSINKTLETPLELFTLGLLMDKHLLGIYRLIRQIFGFILIYETVKYQRILTHSISLATSLPRDNRRRDIINQGGLILLIFMCCSLLGYGILNSSFNTRFIQANTSYSIFIVTYAAITISVINMKSITPFATLASTGKYAQLTFSFAPLYFFFSLSMILSFYKTLPATALIFFVQFGYVFRLMLYNKLKQSFV